MVEKITNEKNETSANNEARKQAQREIAQQKEAARRAQLAAEHGEEFVDSIIAREIIIGMPVNAVIAFWDKQGLVKVDRSGSPFKQKLYYAPYTNSQKKTSYRREVEIVDGRAEGWKDL